MGNTKKAKAKQGIRAGDLIARCRTRLVLDRQQLADLLGVHKITIAEHEADLTPARKVTLLALECLLHRRQQGDLAAEVQRKIEGGV